MSSCGQKAQELSQDQYNILQIQERPETVSPTQRSSLLHVPQISDPPWGKPHDDSAQLQGTAISTILQICKHDLMVTRLMSLGFLFHTPGDRVAGHGYGSWCHGSSETRGTTRPGRSVEPRKTWPDWSGSRWKEPSPEPSPPSTLKRVPERSRPRWQSQSWH